MQDYKKLFDFISEYFIEFHWYYQVDYHNVKPSVFRHDGRVNFSSYYEGLHGGNDDPRNLKFGLYFDNQSTQKGPYFVINGLKWFEIELGDDGVPTRITLSDMIVTQIDQDRDDRSFFCKCVNSRPALLSEVNIPQLWLEKYYVTLIKQKPVNQPEYVTFIDKNFNNSPIILPRLCVLKHCSKKHKFITLDSEFKETRCDTSHICNIDIPVDESMAILVMNWFEHSKLPESLSKESFERFVEIQDFLIKG